MSGKRIIKKYPNRRLYDTEISRYITINDVKNLVLEEADFCVLDARTEQDLTHNTLLQIITEQEQSHEPILSSHILTQLIRFHDNSHQRALSEFLHKSLELFTQQQGQFQKEIKGAETVDSLSSMPQTDKLNLKL